MTSVFSGAATIAAAMARSRASPLEVPLNSDWQATPPEGRSRRTSDSVCVNSSTGRQG